MASCRSSRQLPITEAVAPDSPRMAQLAHIADDVSVIVTVSPDGRVSSAEVTSGPALLELRDDVPKAAKEWRFAPSTRQIRKETLVFEFRTEGDPNTEGTNVVFFAAESF
jgi:TonB family protein